MKIVMVGMLIAVLLALASAGVLMVRRGGEGDKGAAMARALALRVGLSVALFLFMLLSWAMGWIHPSGIPSGM
jgi:Na+-driven multidrug efflux pump